MYRIIGTKIRKLREEVGLTQVDLAKAVDLSSEFISLLELGRRAPSLDSLSKIANYFKKDLSFFLTEKEEVFKTLLKQERLEKKGKSVVKKFQKYCRDYLELEDLSGRNLNLAPLFTNITAQRMAEQERRRLGLGNEPIRNIFFLVELNGLRLWKAPFPKELNISGIYIFIELNQAAFAWINSNLSPGQQALTAAHEYGHYLKDRADGPIIDNTDIFIYDYLSLYPPREQFAQKFALSFLIPKDKVQEIIDRDLGKARLDLEDVLYLKRYFGINTLTMLQILREMEYISQTRFKEYQRVDTDSREKALFQPLEPKEGRGKGRKTFASERYISLAVDAFNKKKISKERLNKLLNI